MGKILLTIKGTEYDVTEFSKTHPGGKKILEKYNNMDVTREFYDFQHSKEAIEIMKTLSVEKTQKEKDLYLIHKILGITCIMSFVYRYYLGFTNQVVFEPNVISMFTMILHLSLNLSSFFFSIPRDRIPGKFSIWSEFRLHNLLFACRSCLTMAMNWFYIRYSIDKMKFTLYKCVLTISVLVLADAITYFYKTNATIQSPFWSDNYSLREKIHKFYYTVSQFEGTLSLFSTEIHTPFFMLIPIQVSSLLMTLVKKNIISPKLWNEFYFVSLFIPDLLYINNSIFVFQVLPLSIFCTWLRIKGVPKYVIWSIIISGIINFNL